MSNSSIQSIFTFTFIPNQQLHNNNFTHPNLSLFVRTDRDSYVWCTSYTCRTTIIFGTIKDYNLSINILASNNCLCHRNLFKNGVNSFSLMVDHFFFKNLKILYISHSMILFKFHQHVVQILIKSDFRLLMSASVMAT